MRLRVATALIAGGLCLAAPLTASASTIAPTTAPTTAPRTTAPTGGIRGVITTSSGTPIAGQCFVAYDVNGNEYDGANPTGADGAYTIPNVPPGSYAVEHYHCVDVGSADDGWWIPSYYRHSVGLNRNGATAVRVTARHTAVANDWAVVGGGISVHAQYTGGAPIPNAIVCPNYTSFQNQNGFCGFTDESGNISLQGVPVGANKIGVYDPATQTQYFYGDTPTFWASPAVKVTATHAVAGPFTVTLPSAGARHTAAPQVQLAPAAQRF